MSAPKPGQTAAPQPRHRTTPIAGTITPVPGYPKKLAIYKLPASPYWWVRYYANKKIARRSTKETDKRKAFAFAKTFYEDILVKLRQGLAITNRSSFEGCAQKLIEAQQAALARGNVTEVTVKNLKYRLDATIIPFFGANDVADVTYGKLQEFVQLLSKRTDPKLSASTISSYLKIVRQVLKHAAQLGVLKHLPQFPSVSVPDNPRGYFTVDEYRALWRKARSLAGRTFELRKVDRKDGKVESTYVEMGKRKGGKVARRIAMTDDLYQLIVFMSNSFIRPTDIKNLKHKHVEVFRNRHTYLRLRLPPSKGHKDPIVTMPKAVEVYERMKERYKAQGVSLKGEDYVFATGQSRRDYALKELQRQFHVLLDLTGLRQGVAGEARTLYSLRHTCIMYRLMYGDGMDHITLARNARTSPEMIDRFYAKQLKGEDNIDLLQSRRRRARN